MSEPFYVNLVFDTHCNVSVFAMRLMTLLLNPCSRDAISVTFLAPCGIYACVYVINVWQIPSEALITIQRAERSSRSGLSIK
jgi:hypothetical protein